MKAKWKNKDNVLLLKNIFYSYAIKGLAMLVSLAVMPAYLKYFSSQQVLGAWFTLSAGLNWFLLFDFGIGAGIRNQIVEPLNKKKYEELRKIVSSAIAAVGAIVVCLTLFFLFLSRFIDWNAILRVNSSELENGVLTIVVNILAVGVFARMFSSLSAHILYGLQKSFAPGLMVLTTNVMVLIYMMVASPSSLAEDVIRLAVVQAIANNLPCIIAFIYIFLGPLKHSIPNVRSIRKEIAKGIVFTGSGLFYLQILTSLLFGIKEIFITWFVGSEEVVEYQIYVKLIGVVSTMFSLALTPVWSAATKAYVEKRFSWIRSLYKKGILLASIFGIGQLVLVLLMPWLVRIWLGNKAIEINYMYGLFYAVYNMIYMVFMLNYNLACGLSRTRIASVTMTFAVLISVGLSWVGSMWLESWVVIVMATTIAVIPCLVYIPKEIFDVIRIKENQERE